MAGEREPIFWRGELIGYIENPRKYPALWRGKWVPAAHDFTEQFLSRLHKGDRMWVEFGTESPKEMASVSRVPDDEIELMLDIEGEQTIHTNPFKEP